MKILQWWEELTYLPILRIAREHHWILWLADISRVIIFNFLHVLLRLNAFIFRESALVSLSSGISEKVGPNRLDFALNRRRQGSHRFEVLFGRPTIWKDRQGQSDLCCSHDKTCCADGYGGG